MQRTGAEMYSRGTAEVNCNFRKSVAKLKEKQETTTRQVLYSFLSFIYRLICQYKKERKMNPTVLCFLGYFVGMLSMTTAGTYQLLR